MEAAWEAVEQLHKVGSFDDYPESIASQMVRGGGGSCTRLAALMTTRSPSRQQMVRGQGRGKGRTGARGGRGAKYVRSSRCASEDRYATEGLDWAGLR